MTEFTPLSSLLGGLLIGLSATLLMWSHGRIVGISGVVGGLLDGATRGEDRSFRVWFLVGLLSAGILWSRVSTPPQPGPTTAPIWLVVVGGLLVGFGTRLGNGCTSGHGVCGISRGAPRSVWATGIFLLTAMGTVYLLRHALGGGQP